MKLTPTEKNAYDALVYLIQASRLPITAKSVKEQLYLHPDFPSLLSMSDVLTSWKVSNLATRISLEQLIEIPLPAMAYMEIHGGYFAPVQRVSDKQVEWLDTNRGWQTDSLADFSRKWNGVALLIEPNESSGEVNYRHKKQEELLHNARLPVVIIGLLLSLACMSWLFLPKTIFNNSLLLSLILAKLIGIVVTTLLIRYTMDVDNSLLRSICSLGDRTDCNSVLTSKAAKLWGWLGWNEIGFTYFAGSFLALLMGLSTAQPSVLSGLLFLNGLALPFTIYSIYYQYAVVKSWCTLCLLVLVLLWIEFALGLFNLQSFIPVINMQTIAIFSLAFLLPVVLWIMVKKPIHDYTQLFPLRRELQKAKFNTEYVESLFVRQPQMPPIFEGMRVVTMGNPEAKHTLTVVTNPLCGPCRRLHPDLEALVHRSKTLNCQFVFIGSSASVHITQKLLKMTPDAAVQAMHLLYSHNNLESTEWYKDINCSSNYSDAHQQLQLHTRWCEMAQVMMTPMVYLNGRQLPLSYTLNDLENLCSILETVSPLQKLADSHESIV